MRRHHHPEASRVFLNNAREAR